jgi:hypothetical protein
MKHTQQLLTDVESAIEQAFDRAWAVRREAIIDRVVRDFAGDQRRDESSFDYELRLWTIRSTIENEIEK